MELSFSRPLAQAWSGLPAPRPIVYFQQFSSAARAETKRIVRMMNDFILKKGVVIGILSIGYYSLDPPA